MRRYMVGECFHYVYSKPEEKPQQGTDVGGKQMEQELAEKLQNPSNWWEEQ